MIQWQSIDDPLWLIDLFVGSHPNPRRLRLVACAVAHACGIAFLPELSRAALRVGEDFADRLVSVEVRNTTADLARRARQTTSCQPVPFLAVNACSRTPDRIARRAVIVADELGLWRMAVCGIVRDILPEPNAYFLPRRAWPPDVRDLANAAYRERNRDGTIDPFRLSIIADAVTDAGCDDASFIAHLRSTGPHYRGCVHLDHLLGK